MQNFQDWSVYDTLELLYIEMEKNHQSEEEEEEDSSELGES